MEELSTITISIMIKREEQTEERALTIQRDVKERESCEKVVVYFMLRSDSRTHSHANHSHFSKG